MQEIQKNGVLKNNRYLVSFSAPQYLKNETNMERLTLRCDAVQIPGMTFATIDGSSRFGYGATESNPYGVIFDDAVLTFLLDSKADVHHFFHRWTNSIVNYTARGQSAMKDRLGTVANMYTYEVGYKDKYSTDITITVYNDAATDKTSPGTPVMEVKLFRAYPKNLPSLDMSWNNSNDLLRLPITFSYTDFDIKYL